MNKITRRIGLLIAHAKGTSFAGESESFLEKAHELAEANGIDISSLLKEDDIPNILRASDIDTIEYKIRLESINQSHRALAACIVSKHGFYRDKVKSHTGRFLYARVDSVHRGEAIQKYYDDLVKKCYAAAQRYVDNIILDENPKANVAREVKKAYNGIVAALAYRIGRDAKDPVPPCYWDNKSGKTERGISKIDYLIHFSWEDDYAVVANMQDIETPLEAVRLLEEPLKQISS